MTYCQLLGVYDARRAPQFPAWCEVKHDGQRCVVVKRAGRVAMYSRTGHELTDVPELAAAVAAAPIDDIVLDAELAALPAAGAEPCDPLLGLLWWTQARSALFVFDVLPVATWDARAESVPLADRAYEVARVVTRIGHERVRAVRGQSVASVAELDAFYAAAIDAGEEGIVVKDLRSAYRWQRSRTWQKRKPTE